MLEDQADEVLCNLSLMFDDMFGSVDQELAEKAVRNSAYWYGHPHGPARAPKWAERLEAGASGWELQFGANTFLVEQAIARCVEIIEIAAKKVKESGKPVDENLLHRGLSFAVQGAVANYQGAEYYWYQASDGFMHFGTQAIHVPSFVATIWDAAQAYLLITELADT